MAWHMTRRHLQDMHPTSKEYNLYYSKEASSTISLFPSVYADVSNSLWNMLFSLKKYFQSR